ncbi:MAG: N-acetylmuramoyl-L-alanine amidase, partial [Eggerthellaceae bacterium]|nr:N-acetylmuramoyl-L-alanine amidase [Eggerthellaceae bacterium]
TFTSNAGHSAKSPGAGANGYEEHTQARLCNKEFIKIMKQHGYAVTDTTSDASNKTAVLQEQVAKANRVGGGSKQLNLSFHLNAGGGSGVEVLYYGDATKKLAAEVSSAISKALGVKDRGAKQRKDLYFLKKTQAHSILIEVCFIDSLIDMQKLIKKRTAAMRAVAEVLIGPFESSANSSTGSSTSSTVFTGKSAYKGSSLVDFLKSIDVDSSFSNRAKLAVIYGIVKTSTQYKGSADQNTALLAAIRGDAK